MLVVRGFSVFIHIKPFFFDTCRNSQAVYLIECFKNDEAHTGCPATHNDRPEYLCTQESESTGVEYTFTRRKKPCEQCAQKTTNTVHGTGSHRIVYLQHPIDEVHREDHHDTADGAYQYGTDCRYAITTGRDTYQSCQDAVQCQR